MKKMYILSVSIVVVLVLAPFLWVGWRYGAEVEFAPVKFINTYLSFTMGLASMGISFWLANVFWANKLKQDRIRRARKTLSRFFHHLRDIVLQCEALLSREYHEAELREAQERDDKVLELFSLMKLAKEGLLVHYPEEEVEEDDQLAKAMVDLFWTHIVPAINDLSARQRIRGDIDEVYEQLDVIKKSIRQVSVLLSSKKLER